MQITRNDLLNFTFPRYVQGGLFVLVGVGYLFVIGGVYAVNRSEVGAIIVGSLLGAYPLFLLELRDVLKKPHVRLVHETMETPADGGIVVEYPHCWFTHERDPGQASGADSLSRFSSINAARMVVTIRNDGWGPAEDCRVSLKVERFDTESDAGPSKLDEYRFPARWEREDNPLGLDLPTQQEQEIVLCEFDLDERKFKTALSADLPPEDRTDPNEYERVHRHAIHERLSYRFSIQVWASNMPLVERRVDVGEGFVEIPDVFESADPWEVEEIMRRDDSIERAFWYRRDGRDVLDASDGFDHGRLVRWLEERSESASDRKSRGEPVPAASGDPAGDIRQSARSSVEERPGDLLEEAYGFELRGLSGSTD